MVADEIGHTSVVMTEKYTRFNLRKLKDDFRSLKERIAFRLTPPMEHSYFTNLLKVIQIRLKMANGLQKWDTPF